MTIQRDDTVLAWLAEKSVNLWRRDWSDSYKLVEDDRVTLSFSYDTGITLHWTDNNWYVHTENYRPFRAASNQGYYALAQIDLIIAKWRLEK